MTMASKDETSTPDDAPHREDFADFALVLKNGHELKCHKIMLAKVSPVFCAMLKQDCVETQTNKMKVTEFEPDTVESFLDYIYADVKVVPDQERDLSERHFDKKRLTSELLRMCHMYRVMSLQEKCIEHLKNYIEDSNAIDIWVVAETVGNDELKIQALDHLKTKGSQLLEVPGLKESFQSPHLVESLVNYLTFPSLDESSIIIHVHCYYKKNKSILLITRIKVKPSDTVRTMRLEITETLAIGWRCKKGSCRKPESATRLEEQSTVGFYNLTNGARIDCDLSKYK